MHTENFESANSADRQAVVRNRIAAMAPALCLAAVFGISLWLNCFGIKWGLPFYKSWEPDSIEGKDILRVESNFFGEWHHKYPRGHFLVNLIFYKPLISRWENIPIVSSSDGRKYTYDIQRISLLMLISRLISAIMGVLAVLAVFLTGRRLFQDFWAGVFGALGLGCCYLFVVYNHFGTPDTASVFWFAWATYFAVRTVDIGSWIDVIFLGLCVGMATATKDSNGAFMVGLAGATLVGLFVKTYEGKFQVKTLLKSIFNLRLLTGLLIAILIFALLNDLLTNPSVYFKRMHTWRFGQSVSRFSEDFKGQFHLFWECCVLFYYSIGWPLLLTLLVSTVYCIKRWPAKSLYALLPLLSFYLIVIVRIRFGVDRFFLPAIPGLFLLSGKGLADFVRQKKLPVALRAAIVTVVFLVSGFYCAGVGFEMRNDSRYRAEKWLVENVGAREHVAAIAIDCYSPRLSNYGFLHSYRWSDPQTEDLLRRNPPYPPYVVMVDFSYNRESFDADFREKLLNGKLGYDQAAVFDKKYFIPGKSLFCVPGWPGKQIPFVSPRVVILKKRI